MITSNRNSPQQSTPANTMCLTINGVSQLYYMLKQEEYMALQNKANVAIESSAVVSALVNISPSLSHIDGKEEYMNRDQVSKILHIDKSTLWRWAKEGKLDFVKVGPRRVLYKTEDIKNLLNNKKK